VGKGRGKPSNLNPDRGKDGVAKEQARSTLVTPLKGKRKKKKKKKKVQEKEVSRV